MLTDTEAQYKWLRNQPKKSFSKNSKKTIYKIVIVCYNIIIRNKEYKFLGGKQNENNKTWSNRRSSNYD